MMTNKPKKILGIFLSNFFCAYIAQDKTKQMTTLDCNNNNKKIVDPDFEEKNFK